MMESTPKMDVQKNLDNLGLNKVVPPTWLKYLILGAAAILGVAGVYFSIENIQGMDDRGEPVPMWYDIAIMFLGTSGVFSILILIWLPVIVSYEMKSYNRTLSDFSQATDLFTITMRRIVIFVAAFGIAYYLARGNLLAVGIMILVGVHFYVLITAMRFNTSCHYHKKALQQFRENGEMQIEEKDLFAKVFEIQLNEALQEDKEKDENV